MDVEIPAARTPVCAATVSAPGASATSSGPRVDYLSAILDSAITSSHRHNSVSHISTKIFLLNAILFRRFGLAFCLNLLNCANAISSDSLQQFE
jgi:hypothetical protein